MNKSLGYKPLVVASIFVVTVLGFYFYKFHVGLSKENGDWGTFGDFFGGVMNPILGFINLFLLSTTLTLQIKSTQNQDKNTHIQEISAKIVAIGHLLEITTQQISNLSSYVHLLKTNELKRLDLLRELICPDKYGHPTMRIFAVFRSQQGLNSWYNCAVVGYCSQPQYIQKRGF